MRRPTKGRFAPPSQVPPLSFSFQIQFNLNYETTRLKSGSRTPATKEKQRMKKNRKKQSVSQTIDLVMTIQTVQESSKSELSSRFLSTSKFLQRTRVSPKDAFGGARVTAGRRVTSSGKCWKACSAMLKCAARQIHFMDVQTRSRLRNTWLSLNR